MWNTLRAGFDLMKPEVRSTLRSSGILRESMITAFTGREPKGIMGKAARKTLTASGFMAINRGNLYLAAATMRRALPQWYKLAQENTPRGRHARERLADLNVSPDKPLTDNLILEKSYRFAVDSQLQRNVLKDPLVFNEPIWRPLFLFKRFGYRQAAYIKDMLWRETIHRKNPMPLLRLVAAGAAGGTFVLWAKDKIRELLSGEPSYRKSDLTSFRGVIDNIAAVGSFGVVSDMMDIDNMSGLWNKAKFATMPVFVSDLEKVGQAYTSVMRDYEKYGDAWYATERNANKLLGFLGSLPRYASKRLLTDEQKERRESYQKGRERGEILDLMLEGKGGEASRRIALWNKNYQANGLTHRDVGSGALKRRAKSKMRPESKEDRRRRLRQSFRKGR